MSQSLPTGGFRQLTPLKIQVITFDTYRATTIKGLILEVDECVGWIVTKFI